MKKILWGSFAALLFVVAACRQNQNFTRSFGDEVPLSGNLEFVFNEDIVPETQIDKWDSTEYIRFEPAIPGKFRWTGRRKLVFSPATPLRPATDYTAEFVHAKLRKIVEKPVFHFHTPYLRPTGFHAFWGLVDQGNSSVFAHVVLHFNYPVNPADVLPLLSVQAGGANQQVAILGKEVSEDVTVYLPGLAASDKAVELNLTLKKGLKVGNSSPSVEDYTQKITLSSPYELSIKGVSSEHDGFVGTIKVETSQQVDLNSLRESISLSPSVEVVYEVARDYFLIKSDEFSPEQAFVLEIKKGLRGVLGGKLKLDYSADVVFGTIPPTIKFVNSKGIYMAGAGEKNLLVNLINIPKLEVKIFKVYDNNIINYLGNAQGGYYDYEYDEYISYTNSVGDLGDLVWEKEYKTGDLPKAGNFHLLKLNFEDKLPSHKGIYVVEIGSSDDYWLRERKIISISDIGLIAKVGRNHVSVFANSLKTTDPIAGAKIRFIGRNNQLVGTAVTNEAGLAVFEFDQLPASGFAISLITAEYQEDYNCLPFSKTEIGTSRFEVGGKYSNLSGYDAFLYGDRDLYRPGETVHVAALVRDENWNIPADLPVRMKLIRPNGEALASQRLTLNTQGACEADFALPDAALTGGYTVELYTSNEVLLGSKRIAVEEFMPDRIKVDFTSSLKKLGPNDEARLDIKAVNYFGPPAAERNYEIRIPIAQKYFTAPGFSDYTFSMSGNDSYYYDQLFYNGQTDDQGEAMQTISVPEEYRNVGLLQADAYLTVFDETGRPVNRYLEMEFFTQEVFFGMKQMPYYLSMGQPVNVPLVAINADRKPINGETAEIILIRHDYKTVLVQSGSYFRYKSEHEEIIKDQRNVVINGTQTNYTFSPQESGSYELRISAPNTGSYVSQQFYVYSYGTASYSSFEVNNEGHIDIEPDKKSYKVGETAKVLLKTPFSGKVLVTVEGKKVLKYFYEKTDKRALSVDIPLIDEYVPNVYITATLFREHTESDLPLTVAHGFAPLMVENPKNTIPVTITANAKSESRTKQKVSVKAAPNSLVSVAVVDEGILALTSYQTPAPYDFFYQKRALEVSTYDVYPFLLPEYSMKSSSTGGDVALNKRVNPLTNKRVKLVAKWSGLLQTDAAGNATYEFDIPQFSGELRVMAVACKNKAFGSAATSMTVADPIVISSGIPRFLSPQDTLIMPITISNTTSKPVSIKANVKVEGPLSVVGTTGNTAQIAKNDETRLKYKIAALPEIGTARIIVTVEADGRQYTEETDITVRPASPLLKTTGSGSVNAGETKKITLPTSDYMPQSVEKVLVISKSPLAEFANDLDYLVQYPYGCVEQTVSAAFPQLYYPDIVAELYLNKGDQLTPRQNVQEAIKRLRLMQLYNGSLSYWPGYGSESWWGSVYAAHFLLEARELQYEVDKDMLDNLLSYLRNKVNNKTTINFTYDGSRQRKIAPREVAYSLYVLAKAGKAQLSLMNYYKSNMNLLTVEAKYLLAAAYMLVGEQKKAVEILPGVFTAEVYMPETGGSFSSPIRDEAIALNALLDIDPDHQQVGIMTKHLSQKLKTSPYLNTQERVFALLAIGKIARMAQQTTVNAEVVSGGTVVGRFSGATLTLTSAQIKGNEVEIKVEGKGKIYYFWETEGISRSGRYNEEDKFISVRREFFNQFGQPVTNRSFRQNDLIVVRITLTGNPVTQVDNVAVTDIIPAGFEIENLRLTGNDNFGWIRGKSTADYEDIRDDRINIFTYADNSARRFYYFVRAVSPGVFRMGPVGADAMYNGEYHSYSGGGMVTIKER